MKRAAALLSLAWLSACFPDYAVVEKSPPDGGGGTANTPPPSCNDNKKNGNETGKDCGMDACGVGCDPGMGCNGDVDCKVGLCTNKVCQAADCHDMLLNGDETDQDCGGDMGCDRCTPGQRCAVTSDCDGGACVNGQCKAPSCNDNLLNGDETDLDCGGSCNPCQVGGLCVETKDCDALLCSKGKCQAASCSDTVLNQDESAVDCGGSCPPCADGAGCEVAADCTSGVCSSTATGKTCAAPTCTDKVQNGREPSIDCGIDCPTKCKELDACNVDNDCLSQRCVNGHCARRVLSPLGWTATASNSSVNSTPSMAIDGNSDPNSPFWITGTDQTVGMWFEIDMKSVQVASSLEIVCNDSLDYAQAIDIAFSDTDTDWNTVKPIVVDHMSTPNDTIIFSKPPSGRYVRITLAQGKSRWWRMDEVRLVQ